VPSNFLQAAAWRIDEDAAPLFKRLHHRLWQSSVPALAMIWSLQLLLLLEDDAAMLAFCFAS
jgi:hypothetical protein